ncbi:MAG: hypothetical protein GY849_22355, partial [Deltaproteobacteria bacterium]|nr:hypothetical protein [Deltaproteobacteria bacterium]
MQHDRDEEMGEEMEGTGDYLRYSQKYGDHRRGRESYDSRGPRRSLILWIFGIVLFVLV